MKLKLIFFILSFISITIGYAMPVDSIKAKLVATNFLKRSLQNQNINLELTDIEKSINNLPLYFIFSDIKNDGFVIISADDAAYPILAYSFKGRYESKNLAPDFIYWMDIYKRQLVFIKNNNLQPELVIKTKWEDYLKNTNSIVASTIIVSPLIKTSWMQGSDFVSGTTDYNNYCPTDLNANTGNSKCPTGCVATAMAQIMKYWNYPKNGIGMHSYIDDGIQNPPSYGTQYADFGNETYDWCSMPYYQSSTAVAVLML